MTYSTTIYQESSDLLFSFFLCPPWGLLLGSEALPPGFGALPAGSEALPAGAEALPADSKAHPA